MENKKRLLIIDDEENMLHMLSVFLRKKGYMVSSATNGLEGLKQLRNSQPDLVLCDLKMPGMDGLEFLRTARDENQETLIIMMSAYATVDRAVEAMKLGAFDFITKPFNTDQISCILDKAQEFTRIKDENVLLRKQVYELQKERGFEEIIGESEAIRKILEQAGKVAQYDTSVLITGESGTGKELIARGIHAHSKRAGRSLVAVNCGSIPANLLESEFFGYVRGAFTGAEKDHKGLFAEADGGTLFLDEIGELPLELQVKMLRVLQEQEIRPVGASIARKIDVRIIAATARDLESEVRKGAFRQDLLFRLNVIVLHLPPLRDRKEDIPLLCKEFLEEFNERFEKKLNTVSSAGLAILLRYDWPGNIRELHNIIERAVIYCNGVEILAEHLPERFQIVRAATIPSALTDTFSLKQGKVFMERHLIEKALEITDGNKSKAALMLEISYPALLAKIKEYGV
jgi:two-component system, NtrC family, response regulator AtoC